MKDVIHRVHNKSWLDSRKEVHNLSQPNPKGKKQASVHFYKKLLALVIAVKETFRLTL